MNNSFGVILAFFSCKVNIVKQIHFFISEPVSHIEPIGLSAALPDQVAPSTVEVPVAHGRKLIKMVSKLWSKIKGRFIFLMINNYSRRI
jgi:hypothetical protein